MRLVAEAGQKFLAAGVGRIHVAVEHQVLAAAGALPTADHVGAGFFHFLPGDVQADLLQRGLHVLRHLQFFAGRAGDVDHVARHGDDFVFVHLGEDPLDQFRVEARAFVSSLWARLYLQFS